jgi:hypothetical protein
MPTFEKSLIGKHLLVGAGGGNIYNFSLPSTPAGSQLPNQIDNQVIEEVYIACDTTLGPIRINLPAISSFNLAWNAKIYIVQISDTTVLNVTTIAPFNSETETNTLNGSLSKATVNQWDAYYLHIIEENTWIALLCPGPIPGPIL